jgi:hypothetical protein
MGRGKLAAEVRGERQRQVEPTWQAGAGDEVALHGGELQSEPDGLGLEGLAGCLWRAARVG